MSGGKCPGYLHTTSQDWLYSMDIAVLALLESVERHPNDMVLSFIHLPIFKFNVYLLRGVLKI